MKLKATYLKRIFHFTETRHTSRDSLRTKFSFFITIKNKEGVGKGIGECSYLMGLSPEKLDSYQSKIAEVCADINNYKNWLNGKLDEYPSIQFGLEMAIKDLLSDSKYILFNTAFSIGEQPIKINGLIWMDSFEKMKTEIDNKIDQGFNCIKLKIGAIDFDKELVLLDYIRRNSSEIEIRVDANGAFSVENALIKLKALAKYDIHSIEQPIKSKQWDEMKKLCEESPIPIAFDEELIGLFDRETKQELLKTIQPQYIVLKPSLVGGFKGTTEWIELAKEYNIGWWITSCLESNIGLNAIAQFVSQYDNPLPQGLGTGKIYTNNIPSGLFLNGDNLMHNPNNWNKIEL